MLSLKEIFDGLKQVATLARDTEENRQEIRRLRESFAQVAVGMERLADKVDAALRLERAEREKHAVEIERDFLKLREELRNAARAEAGKVAREEARAILPEPKEAKALPAPKTDGTDE